MGRTCACFDVEVNCKLNMNNYHRHVYRLSCHKNNNGILSEPSDMFLTDSVMLPCIALQVPDTKAGRYQCGPLALEFGSSGGGTPQDTLAGGSSGYGGGGGSGAAVGSSALAPGGNIRSRGAGGGGGVGGGRKGRLAGCFPDDAGQVIGVYAVYLDSCSGELSRVPRICVYIISDIVFPFWPTW